MDNSLRNVVEKILKELTTRYGSEMRPSRLVDSVEPERIFALSIRNDAYQEVVDFVVTRFNALLEHPLDLMDVPEEEEKERKKSADEYVWLS